MQKKSVIFGMGAGIIVMCLIFYFLYAIEMRGVSEDSGTNGEPPVMTDDEIMSRAKELGMVAAGDLEENAGTFMDSEIESVSITDDEVIQRAEAMGMIWATSDDNTPDSAGDEAVLDDMDGALVEIAIIPGSSSYDVADILMDAGLIDDGQAFVDYIIEKNMTRAIRSGNFEIPRGADYEEIVSLIAVKR